MAAKAWEAFIAQGQPYYPVGTLDELEAHKMPARIFPSCHEGSFDGSIKPCPLWESCTMSYKGLPVKEGGGPRNHCWEYLKNSINGGGVVRNVHPCYWGIEKQDLMAENKELLRPIADEGQDYEMLTTVPDPTGGKDQNGFIKWDTKTITCKVQPFLRIGEEPKLAQAELRAAIVERDRKRLANEREAKFLGIERTGVSLDKRDRREGKVGTKEG